MNAVESLIEAISKLTVGEVFTYATLFLAGLATVVEKTSKTIKPLTALAKRIGRAINGELIEKVEQMDTEIKQIYHDAGERRAKDARARVLRFGDEVFHGVHHSKEHFDDVLQDITEYENYCGAHPEFENDRMQLTTQKIKEAYQKCWEEHSFL